MSEASAWEQGYAAGQRETQTEFNRLWAAITARDGIIRELQRQKDELERASVAATPPAPEDP